MAFTYTLATSGPASIDPGRLKHRYFVQLAPDEKHLVLGMLHQGEKPAAGRWLEVGRFTQSLPKRYFVQDTGFHTLVPGSLIQANQKLQGRWKEIMPASEKRFYKIIFDQSYEIAIAAPSIEFHTHYYLISTDQFIANQIIPIQEALYPGIDLFSPPVPITIYFFKGTFDQFAYDETKLSIFQVTDFFAIWDGSIDLSVLPPPPSPGFGLLVSDQTPDGTYSLVLQLVHPQTQTNEYIFLENMVSKTTL